MINKLKVNEPIEIYNKGLPIRDIMHVYDICEAINLICRSGQANQIYNVGSGKPIQIGNLINMAKKELLSKSKVSYEISLQTSPNGKWSLSKPPALIIHRTGRSGVFSGKYPQPSVR